ncbi:HAD-IIIC family phosphatase [Actinocrinis puniceicyclus]|uniref:HAD-IIIC family phosphatase n=1 Tax=Actinocrinis puniceicyclus TaxID=977794 RepID=A0A8J7WK10_9ACTN|nr:HAD-IIIC family phosphatase [Actinocrinis puniceicyclus]MBS2963686.1 HAD-IIIC family phosphatase [Actinocrinis puniceicyclus]
MTAVRSGAADASFPVQDASWDLVALHRAGRLVQQYPLVAGLLRHLSDADLIAAGQLLSRLSADEVTRLHPSVATLDIAVTGHGTLAALVPALTAHTARHGLLTRIRLSDFDGYVFDLGDPGSSLYAAGPGLTLCVLDPQIVFDEVPAPWRPEDVERVFGEKLRLVEGLTTAFAANSRGTLVLNTLPLPRRHSAQLLDHRSRARLGAIWHEGNAALLRLGERPGVIVVDLDPLLAGGIAAEDARMSVYAKAHLSPELLAAYAREVAHLARHLTGRTKKCLALDLDGTVWGGILGEDGAEGIEVADGYRGEAFRAFQRVVKQIGSQGVLLAAVSKNDVEPVRAVLRDHPQQTLREADFVRVCANWRPKHENLAELAGALNLGVDSIVFVDDSPYERGLVERELPQVSVVAVDDEPARHMERLLADGWFDVLELTDEDRGRAARYTDELAREDFLRSFDSLADYLRELGVRVRLARLGDQDVPRVAQLTQRTNQFNLTTRRMQPAEVRALAGDPAQLVLTIHSGDRFGENGLVGAIFARRAGDALHIENFLLSCRVFARGIEQTCLAAVLRHARRTGATAVFGAYRPTAKNSGVKDLYPRYGFTRLAADEDGTTRFRHDLAEIVGTPDHVHLDESLGDLPGAATENGNHGPQGDHS